MTAALLKGRTHFWCRPPGKRRLPPRLSVFLVFLLLVCVGTYYIYYYYDPNCYPWDWTGATCGGKVRTVFEVDPSKVDQRFRRPGALDTSHSGVARENICIMQAETRPFPKLTHDQVFSHPYFTSSSYYLAYYAISFGYTFRRLHVTPVRGRYRTWPKLPGMWASLSDPKCKILVVFDGDSFPKSVTTPLEEMMERWGFGLNSTFMMAHDPDLPENYFGGNLAVNFGFWFLRKNQKAFSLLNKIMNCPGHVPGCAKWKWKFAHEQATFAQFFKNTYEQGPNKEFVIAPCDEANGYWSFPSCSGSYVTHAWSGKEDVPKVMFDLTIGDDSMRSIYLNSDQILRDIDAFK